MTKAVADQRLDDLIVARLRSGPATFALLCRACGTSTNAGEFRSVDRALQRLRKRGVIAYSCRTWSLVDRGPR